MSRQSVQKQGLSAALQQVADKVASIEQLFDKLPLPQQLEGLDILQGLVNNVMSRITSGRISAVRFVPVRAGEDANGAGSEALTMQDTVPLTNQPSDDTTAFGPAILEIKQEPVDEAWPVALIAAGPGIHQSPKNAETYVDSHVPDDDPTKTPPLMTSTPKSKDKKKVTPLKRGTKRKLLIKTSTPKKTKSKSENLQISRSQSQNAKDGDNQVQSDEEEGVQGLDDSGIGDSTLELSELNQTGDVDDVDEPLDLSDASVSSDGKEPPPDKPLGVMSRKVTVKMDNKLKTVITWARDRAPKRRVKKDKAQLPFHCSLCNFATGRKYSLETHMAIHTGESNFICDKCDKVFTAASSLKRHMMIHNGVKPFQCPVCLKTFVDIAGLKTHSAVHTGERLFHCELCSKSYTNHANLARHKRVHTGEMPYVCKYEGCDVRYRDLSSLKLHTLKHTGEKPYSCTVCDKKFKTSSDFRRHERTHTQERNYKCTECGKKFIQGYHLKQHLKIHADLWSFSCELCGKRFRTKASLQHHMKGHAGIKDFKCDLCLSTFTTKRYLNDHYIATHTKAKPYKCDICKKSFNHVSNMKRHKRMHSDVCNYKCKFCDKSFKYINSLQYHEGIHTGAVKMCEKCGYTCRSAFGIKNHKCEETMMDRMKKKEENPEELSESEETGTIASDEVATLGSTSDDVEILDIKEEPQDENLDDSKKPRAAARRSGLLHTPRKSKQRAMKKIEGYAEAINMKDYADDDVRERNLLSGSLQVKLTPLKLNDTKSSLNKKESTKKMDGDVKGRTLGVLLKKEASNLCADEKSAQNGDIDKQEPVKMAENDETGDKTSTGTEKLQSEPAPKVQRKTGKGHKVSKSKDNKSENSKINDEIDIGEPYTETPPAKSLSDVCVMQEAYGSVSMTNIDASDASVLNAKEMVGSTQKCMPINAQVYSVSEGALAK